MKYVVRTLARRPGFTAVAVGTIALAVAANTATFSVVNAVLLAPLPFRDAHELVTIESRAPTGFLVSTSIPNYRDWRDRNRVFQAFAASAGWGFTLTGGGAAEALSAEAVLGDFFGTLGLAASMGRVPTAEETAPGAAATVVLGHGLWQRRFGGDPAVVGQAIALDDRPHVVMGVLEPGTGFPDAETELYVPMGSIPSLPFDDRGSGFGTLVLARLTSGVDVETAGRDLARVGREIREEAGPETAQPEVRSLASYYVGDVRLELWILMGAVGFVLLIAVANVGNLLLARGEERRRELAVRTALGAGRHAVARLLLAEALAIAAAGGVLGAGLAYAAVGALVPLLPSEVPALVAGRIAVDGAALTFAVAIALVAGLLFGLVPALAIRTGALHDALKAGGRGTAAGGSAVRSSLVVAEVALALVLLVGAGLMLRSLARLQRTDLGFRQEHVLTAGAALGYETREAWRAAYERLEREVAALPGVRSAALAIFAPLSNRSWELRIHPEGAPVLPETGHSVLYNVVSLGYFETLGVPLVRGRAFTAMDRDGAPLVAVIDETMAAQYWPGEDPIGKRVTFETAPDSLGGEPVYREVIGVVRNLRHYEVDRPSRIQVYVPVTQTYTRWGMGLRLLVRTEVPPLSLVPALREVVTRIDPDAPLFAVRPMDEFVHARLAPSIAVGRVLIAFAAGALALAALGVFGVMSYAVTRRAREIGIRMALGAAAGEVLRWIGARVLALTVAGVAIGLVAAALLTRLMGRLLYEVSPLDPVVYGAVAAGLTLVALLAAWLPARRATRVDPVAVLGAE